MKKLIAFADPQKMFKSYEDIIEAGGKALPDIVYGPCGQLRRVEMVTADGRELELVFVNIYIGNTLLKGRMAEEVDISRVLDELEAVKAVFLDTVRDIQLRAQEQAKEVA